MPDPITPPVQEPPAPPAPETPPAPPSAEEQLKALRAAIAELIGVKLDVSDEEFAAALSKYIDDAELEDEELAKKAKEEAEVEFCAKMADQAVAHKQQIDSTVKKYEDEKKSLKGQIDAINSELAALKAGAAAQEQKAFASEMDMFLDGLVKEGKMLPAEKEINRMLLDKSDRCKKLKFADKDGKEVEQTELEKAKAVLQSRPVIMKFGDISKTIEPDAGKTPPAAKAPSGIQRFQDAGNEVDEQSAKIDARAREIMVEKKCGYGEAQLQAVKEFRK